jgi:hypothetical protein
MCACGCGKPAPIALDSDKTRGYRAGQPRTFRHGHNRRKFPEGHHYSQVSSGGKRLLHRERAERALGRPLPRTAVVHHLDGSRRVDAPLVILENQAEHMQLHARMRVVQAGGDPWRERICGRCRRLLAFESFCVNKTKYLGRHDTCRQCMSERRYASDRSV